MALLAARPTIADTGSDRDSHGVSAHLKPRESGLSSTPFLKLNF
jgi:hypothetical protein